MNCIALDDEPLALNVIRDFCYRLDFLNLVAACTNPVDAVQYFKEENIDLIFLDIHMPNISGLEFIRILDKRPMVIFTTAYSNYALEGFEINAVDYLLKPISFDRFLKAVNRANELHALKEHNTNPLSNDHHNGNKFMMVKVEYSTVKINIDNILYIEGLKDYIKIYSGGRPVLTKSTMKNIEEKLPSCAFMRVHKSYIVAIDKIDSIENNRILIGERRIPVGSQYKSEFNRFLESKRL